MPVQAQADGMASDCFSTGIQVRFNDTDALGHVNNASYAEYAETARLALFAHFGVRVTSIILAHLAIDYRRQVVLGESVSVETTVASLGTTSITLEQQVLSAGRVAADIRSVVVFYDYDSAQRREVPAAVRGQIMASPCFSPGRNFAKHNEPGGRP